jgi:5-methylcytosine-specific restriction endonuclease McrA
MSVFVLDKRQQPLMPCSEKRARLLLSHGNAVVHKMYPFTIRLKVRLGGEAQPVRVKLDPGSKITGIAMVREAESWDRDTGEIRSSTHVLWMAELIQRGHAIRDALTQRLSFRRRRRSTNLRHRAPRFLNRRKPEGWLAPSLQHRVDTTLSWVHRLQRLSPVCAISTELVRFDMQALQNPEISRVEYQHGTLAGYEVREYLLEKWGRHCIYCDKHNVPLEIDHIRPRSRGGSDRVSNLTLACHPCNLKKGNQDVAVFLVGKPDVLTRVLAQAKTPLKDAAAVNITRRALFTRLQATGVPLETGTGGRTKWNRTRLGIPKTHALDAACVGAVTRVLGWRRPVLQIKTAGRGSYQRTRLTKYGFPRGYLMRQKQVHGFQTGDMVQAIVTVGKKPGTYVGRVAIRATGRFNIQTSQGLIQGLSYRVCSLLQRADGYGYSFTTIAVKKGDAGIGQAMPASLPILGLKPEVSRATR